MWISGCVNGGGRRSECSCYLFQVTGCGFPVGKSAVDDVMLFSASWRALITFFLVKL